MRICEQVPITSEIAFLSPPNVSFAVVFNKSQYGVMLALGLNQRDGLELGKLGSITPLTHESEVLPQLKLS